LILLIKRTYAQTTKMLNETNFLKWWQLISKKRCDGYAHSQEDEYNEAPKEFLSKNIDDKILNIQNPNPEIRNTKRIMGLNGGS